MSVDEAREFFTVKKVRDVLRRCSDVGLGYLSLGQNLTSLSGGERQRLKLATELVGNSPVLVLDRPTTGLHSSDVDNLVGLLSGMVDEGRSVIVIEHNMDVVAAADWVVDLGPDEVTTAARWCSRAPSTSSFWPGRTPAPTSRGLSRSKPR